MSATLITLIIALMLSALFSGMEIAFVSSNKVRAEIDMGRGGIAASVLNVFYNNRETFISTLLIGNNIVNVVYSMAFAKLLTDPLSTWIGNEALLLLVQTLLSALLMLFVAEFMPKAIFRINPNYSLRTFSVPMFMIYIIIYPFSRFVEWLSAAIMRLFGVRIDNTHVESISIDELDAFVQENIDYQEEEHKHVEREMQIFENALDFSDTQLRDCMVPRNEIVAVDVTEATRDDLVKLFSSTGLSKIVVFRDNIDNVIGFISVSELFNADVDWRTRIKPVVFAPDSFLARRLMRRLLDQKRSIAVVLDEYGGTAGMVTLEDLVEEIFGEIEDEHDRNKLIAKQIDENTYEFSGRMEIEEINERFHLDLPESDDYQTLAGYLLAEHAAMPVQGEQITLPPYVFTIVRTSAARIGLVRVQRQPQPKDKD